MLEYVQCVGAIELAGKRPLHHVVNMRIDGPLRIQSGFDVCNEHRIEIDRCEFVRLANASAQPISKTWEQPDIILETNL